jgi:hypothetical protein
MLHLHAGVHLDEIELVVLIEELEGAGAAVADLLAGGGAALADLLDQLGGMLAPATRSPSGGGVHEQSLAEVDRALVLVGEDLDLDVARV